MAKISAKDVQALRAKTGVGMMDCKRALSDAEGDLDKAVVLLRERGLSKASKRVGRVTSEGAVGIAIAGSTGAIVELNCETDFVAKTDDFQSLAGRLAEVVAGDASISDVEAALAADSDGGTVQEAIQAAISKVGENIQLKRVARVAVDEGVVGGYVHAGAKLGVIVGLRTGASGDAVEVLTKDVAMHVAATDPTPVSVDRDGVPADVVAKEKEILRKQAEQSGKPEKVIEKIVDGRINKFFSENCLLEQAFVKDPDTSVGNLLKQVAGDLGSEMAVTEFVRFKLGEAG
jgi:elongation factor Ts